MQNIDQIKQLLTPYSTNFTKKRYGNSGDGGYVLCSELVKATDHVYSLGIASEFSIDIEFANSGKMVYQYDKNFCQVPSIKNLFFNQKYIDGNVLVDELTKNGSISKSNLLLMDIEGGEYEIFLHESECYKNFNQICLELHDIHSNDKIIDVLQKLNKYFTLVHIHANNWCFSKEHQLFVISKKMLKQRLGEKYSILEEHDLLDHVLAEMQCIYHLIKEKYQYTESNLIKAFEYGKKQKIADSKRQNFLKKIISLNSKNNIIEDKDYFEIPDLLELTYVRSDLIKSCTISTVGCPTELDFKNYNDLPEINLSWWIS